MWIRSQNKERLLNSDDIFYSGEHTNHWDFDTIVADDSTRLLGEYKSKERCLEILDKIQKEIKFCYTEKTVFQMPQK